MQWLRKLWDVLFSLDGGQPKCFFPDRAAAEAKVRREARYAQGELRERLQLGGNSVGEVISFTMPIETEGFTDDELNRICRSEISRQYRVWVYQGNLEVEYYISGPDI